MGAALAVMHWRIGIDADDVEFVLGSSPNYVAGRRPLSPQEVDSLPERASTWESITVMYKFRRRAGG